MASTKVILPKLGLTMDEGTIRAWHKREGDPVAPGEALFEVETDKVTMDVESPASGFLRKIVVEEGATVPVTTVVALIAETLEEPLQAETGPAAAAPAASGTLASASAPAAPASSRSAAGDRPAASPAARKRAADLGVDLAAVRGSGPGGRIQIEDVERAAAERSG